jgi:hypothetical protein
VPPHARELIEAVLVKDPNQRYSTGGEFAAAVAAVRRGERLPAPGTLSGPFTPPRARPILTPPKPAAKTSTPTPSPRAATSVHRLATPSSPAAPSRKPQSKTPSSPRRPVPAVAARPVELRAGSGRGRTLLLVLFVLLTVAAVVVGVYVVRNLGAGPTPQGMAPGTVALLHEPSDRR